MGGARAPRSWGAVGGLAVVLSCLIHLGGRRFPSVRLAPPLGAPSFAPLPCTAPSGPRWSLAWVQCVLELGAGVADVKSFLVDSIIRAELDHNGVTSWVDLLWRLSQQTKQQIHLWLSLSGSLTTLQLKLKTSHMLKPESNHWAWGMVSNYKGQLVLVTARGLTRVRDHDQPSPASFWFRLWLLLKEG